MASPSTQPKTQTPPQPTTAAKPVQPIAIANNAQLRVLTEKLAYEIWEKNGRTHGQDYQNWIEAEKLAKKNLGI